MKKKVFIGTAMSLLTVATVFNMNISEQGNAGDVSLEAIEIMAQAEAESSGYPSECPADLTQNNCRGNNGVLYANATRRY